MKFLGESLDKFGMPLVESMIEVSFDHDGKQAVALFDIAGGFKHAQHPTEYTDPEVEFVAAYRVDDDSDIQRESIKQMEELTGDAIQKYWDEQEHEPKEF